MASHITGRFAPSPTGRMHMGNLYCALMSWLSARSQGGCWILRIEDLDKERSRAAYALQIEDDLHWLGLDWDEGGSKGGPRGPYLQSLRNEIYRSHFERLSDLIYPCFCRRADLLAASAPHSDNGAPIYAGTCRSLAPEQAASLMDQGRSPAWRIKVPDSEISFDDKLCGNIVHNLARDCGDFVLRRANGTYAYQLAVVVDDALMGVNEVVRGEDLLCSAAQQIFLYRQLGFDMPEFAHLPLMCAADGRRLCKRDITLDCGELRKKVTPHQLTGRIAALAGLIDKEEPVSPEELVREFSWKKLRREKIICYSDFET